VQDPGSFLTALDVTLPGALNDRLRASFDPEHTLRVNWELFFVSTERERRRFEEDPRRYCGVVTDPVSRQRFRPGSDAPRRDHAGRPFFFVSDSTATIFAAMPDSFLVPRGLMRNTPPKEAPES